MFQISSQRWIRTWKWRMTTAGYSSSCQMRASCYCQNINREFRSVTIYLLPPPTHHHFFEMFWSTWEFGTFEQSIWYFLIFYFQYSQAFVWVVTFIMLPPFFKDQYIVIPNVHFNENLPVLSSKLPPNVIFCDPNCSV